MSCYVLENFLVYLLFLIINLIKIVFAKSIPLGKALLGQPTHPASRPSMNPSYQSHDTAHTPTPVTLPFLLPLPQLLPPLPPSAARRSTALTPSVPSLPPACRFTGISPSLAPPPPSPIRPDENSRLLAPPPSVHHSPEWGAVAGRGVAVTVDGVFWYAKHVLYTLVWIWLWN
jgi:hypothetical protein